MNLKNLEYFIKVVRAKSFTRASEDLFLSQSTLSKAVKNLEQELDAQLLERERNQIFLTEDGKYILEKGEELLLLIENRKREMYQALSSKQDRLMVGVPPILMTGQYGNEIFAFKERESTIPIHLIEAENNTLYKMVKEDTLDIAIVRNPNIDENLYQEILYIMTDNKILMGMSNPLAKKNEVGLEELKDEKFILLDDRYQINEEIFRICREAGFEPQVVEQVGDWQAIGERVGRQEGIGIIPQPLPEEAMNFPETKAVKIKGNPFYWTLSIVYKKGKKNKRALSEFVTFIRQKI